jgi:hypothetical protein
MQEQYHPSDDTPVDAMQTHAFFTLLAHREYFSPSASYEHDILAPLPEDLHWDSTPEGTFTTGQLRKVARKISSMPTITDRTLDDILTRNLSSEECSLLSLPQPPLLQRAANYVLGKVRDIRTYLAHATQPKLSEEGAYVQIARLQRIIDESHRKVEDLRQTRDRYWSRACEYVTLNDREGAIAQLRERINEISSTEDPDASLLKTKARLERKLITYERNHAKHVARTDQINADIRTLHRTTSALQERIDALHMAAVQ